MHNVISACRACGISCKTAENHQIFDENEANKKSKNVLRWGDREFSLEDALKIVTGDEVSDVTRIKSE